jgi:hypothetical protein
VRWAVTIALSATVTGNVVARDITVFGRAVGQLAALETWTSGRTPTCAAIS